MKETEYKNQASLITQLGKTFMQAPSDSEYIKTQYKILDGILTVYIPSLDDPDKTDEMEFMVRDISSTQVTYVRENLYVDNGENSRYYLDSVFYYDKIGDI